MSPEMPELDLASEDPKGSDEANARTSPPMISESMALDDEFPERNTDSLAVGILSGAAFSILSIGSNLVLLPIVLAAVGASQYGLWLLLSTFATYLYQADLGMGATIVHYVAKNRSSPRPVQLAVTSTGGTWMCLMGLVMVPPYWFLAHILVRTATHADSAARAHSQVLLVLGGVLIGTLGLRAYSAALQGYGLLVYQRAAQAIGVLVRIIGTLLACFVWKSVDIVAAAEAAALMVPQPFCYLEMRRRALPFGSWRHFDWHLFREMFSYGLRAFVLGAMAIILLQANAIIVGVVASAAAVAYFGSAFRVYGSILTALGWLTDPLLSMLTRAYEVNVQEARKAFLGLLFAPLWFTGGVCGTLGFGAIAFVRFWLGTSVPVLSVGVCLAVLLGGLVLSSINEAAIPASDAFGQPGAFARLYVAWAVLNVLASVGLGFAFGIIGVALGMALPLVVLEPLFVLRIQQRLGIPWQDWAKTVLKPVALMLAPSALLAGFVLVGLSIRFSLDAGSACAGIVFAVMYGGLSYVLRSLMPLESIRSALRTRL